MITENTIEQLISNQENTFKHERLVYRNRQINLNTNRIIVVSGIRRCGKSTYLQQINKQNRALSINFEDPRIEGFEISDFDKIEKIAGRNNKEIIILDEVQNIIGWEKYARSANDRGIKLQITGSNASILSRELGTHLTGRYQQVELFPFDYMEFLDAINQTPGLGSFRKFIEMGGFPEYIKEQNPEYLRTLMRDIVMRDIAVRKGIRNEHFLIRLALHIISNVGKEFSYNKISKTLEIKSVRTTIDYCDYLQESYLIELIPRFSFSIHQQLANAKKVYCIDTGMIIANSLSLNKDEGRLLENAVFIQLRRNFKDIFYFKNEKAECDFLVRDDNHIKLAIQVCLKITDDNMKREVLGIKEALKLTNCNKGLIVTLDQEDELDGIPLIPAWKWFNRPTIV